MTTRSSDVDYRSLDECRNTYLTCFRWATIAVTFKVLRVTLMFSRKMSNAIYLCHLLNEISQRLWGYSLLVCIIISHLVVACWNVKRWCYWQRWALHSIMMISDLVLTDTRYLTSVLSIRQSTLIDKVKTVGTWRQCCPFTNQHWLTKLKR